MITGAGQSSNSDVQDILRLKPREAAEILKALDGRLVPVRGRAAWCRLVTGRIHEIGIRFEEPIDLEGFVPSGEDPEPEADRGVRAVCVQA